MSARKADAPLILDLPKPAADQPSWMKVGAIAAIGFVIGVAWPKLTGVRLGPAAPGESAPASSAPPRAVDAPPAVSAPPPSVPASTVASAAGSVAPVVTSGPPT
ncbi:MAG: SH3 domain-containing protein, partial [Polyangiaceae bacterium]